MKKKARTEKTQGSATTKEWGLEAVDPTVQDNEMDVSEEEEEAGVGLNLDKEMNNREEKASTTAKSSLGRRDGWVRGTPERKWTLLWIQQVRVVEREDRWFKSGVKEAIHVKLKKHL